MIKFFNYLRFISFLGIIIWIPLYILYWRLSIKTDKIQKVVDRNDKRLNVWSEHWGDDPELIKKKLEEIK